MDLEGLGYKECLIGETDFTPALYYKTSCFFYQKKKMMVIFVSYGYVNVHKAVRRTSIYDVSSYIFST